MGPAAAPVITGGLPLPRLQQGWCVVLTLNSSIAVSPVEPARRMIYGTCVFDAPMLGHLVQPCGGGVLCLRGSGADHHLPLPPDKPQRLAHAVLNSHAIAETQAWFEQVLGFVLADRAKIMAFMNCDIDHHSIALGDTDNDALNQIAFLMPTLDVVMRGGGRLKDAGLPPQWGPGRHGPGDNAFNYFVDLFGIVIEYTAKVEQIDDRYRPGAPADWTWPPGRIDPWGLGQSPTVALKQAQRRVQFSAAD